jgi:hypothetical protein
VYGSKALSNIVMEINIKKTMYIFKPKSERYKLACGPCGVVTGFVIEPKEGVLNASR